MKVLCKFIENDKHDSSNLLITKTFGKYGVLHREAVAAMQEKPWYNEWWYCDVVRETGAGTERGLWILKPLSKLGTIIRDGFRDNDVAHLYAGCFTSKRVGNTLLLHPNQEGPNWICPNALRQHLMRRYRRNGEYGINTVMVVFDQAETWSREPVRR